MKISDVEPNLEHIKTTYKCSQDVIDNTRTMISKIGYAPQYMCHVQSGGIRLGWDTMDMTLRVFVHPESKKEEVIYNMDLDIIGKKDGLIINAVKMLLQESSDG